jgi:hypothetical protein
VITALALLANILISWSRFLDTTEGMCDPLGVLMVLVALLLLLEGSAIIWPSGIERTAGRLVPPLLGVVVLVRLLVLAPYFMIEAHDGGCPTPCAWLLLLGAVVALGSYRLKILWPQARLPILLTVALAGPFWLIQSRVRPSVDVLIFQEEGSRALLSGRNPYAVTYPNVYPEFTELVYGPGLARGGQITFFPYPPLSLLAVLPGYLLGDIRYASFAALAGSCILLAATARRLGVAAGSSCELITVALALQIDNHFVIATGWTEPFLLLGVTASGYALATRRPLLLGLSLAWVVAIKQYGILWTIPILALGRLRRKDWAIAGAAVFAVNVPFFLWGPRDFWNDLIVGQAIAPFRRDLTSLPALVFAQTGIKMSPIWTVAATVAAAALALCHRPVSTARALMGGAAIVLAFVAFSKQGSSNYYWFASAAPLVAAVFDSCRAQTELVASRPGSDAPRIINP